MCSGISSAPVLGGPSVNFKTMQEDGHVMFEFTDNSHCAGKYSRSPLAAPFFLLNNLSTPRFLVDAYAFTRSEVGREFMDAEDESLKQVFTPNYNFYAKKKCGNAPILPGSASSDYLARSRLEVNKHYRYCVRAVANSYSADSEHSSDETCQIHAIEWEASIDGFVTSTPDSGS